ncbi:DNA-directed RNA polymerase [Candidatus Woesearchaeota archaeon]|nr:DNA-directed RNA polymerase [Candidatus Woesearchaeota archaeon]
MFYEVKVKDHIRVPPSAFTKDLADAVVGQIKEKYSGYISKELGYVIDVVKLNGVEDGIIIPGDGAAYYKATFDILTFIPEMQEVIYGKIKDITDFGAFLTLGPVEGMIHIGQTMNDFVSFSKEKVLTGKESKRSIKVGDKCFGRIVAVSFKDITNPKIGITMRQDGLGKAEWVPEDFKSPKKAEAK